MGLGKLLSVGDTFVTVTKRMTKTRSNQKLNADCTGKFVTYEVLRPGDVRTFEKGKRKYVCKVVKLVEFRMGIFIGSILQSKRENDIDHIQYKEQRWYQFSYMVRIIEN